MVFDQGTKGLSDFLSTASSRLHFTQACDIGVAASRSHTVSWYFEHTCSL